jgi:large subunit ribosomal protein L24
MRLKIRKGDTVEVVSGRDKGSKGEVLRVLPSEERVVVRGVNLRKKHQRQVQAGGRQMNPGIIHFEAPIPISHVMLVCPKCGESTRVAVRRTEDGAQRICKQCDSVMDV